MNKAFENLSNVDLISKTKQAVEKERHATLAVLDHLRECERRLLHLELGFSSLHEFCVTTLKYSDGAAHRRIQSMRLCQALPAARKAVADGSLSLSNATTVQHCLRERPQDFPTIESKSALVTTVLGKSNRECERILQPEKGGTALHFIADDATYDDLKRFSELRGIALNDLPRLIKEIASIARISIEKRQGIETRTSPEKPIASRNSQQGQSLTPTTLAARENPTSRFIPISIKKAVWLRDGAQCTFVSPITKHRCEGRFGIQFDHVVPFVCGGKSTLENLRLLCRAHNRLMANRVFGRSKIDKLRQTT